MSMGYYPETAGDEQDTDLDPALYDSALYDLLVAISETGVAIVVSAGNDATKRPMYPAAFLKAPPVVGGRQLPIPLTGVGALNPNGTVAMFSNTEPSASAWRPGAVVVSTMPTGFNAGMQPTSQWPDPGGSIRETPDPDDFESGFGVGSGTSYAAPAFAADVANELLKAAAGALPEHESVDDAIKRCRTAVNDAQAISYLRGQKY
jgi:subtilisin family serine protease